MSHNFIASERLEEQLSKLIRGEVSKPEKEKLVYDVLYQLYPVYQDFMQGESLENPAVDAILKVHQDLIQRNSFPENPHALLNMLSDSYEGYLKESKWEFTDMRASTLFEESYQVEVEEIPALVHREKFQKEETTQNKLSYSVAFQEFLRIYFFSAYLSPLENSLFSTRESLKRILHEKKKIKDINSVKHLFLNIVSASRYSLQQELKYWGLFDAQIIQNWFSSMSTAKSSSQTNLNTRMTFAYPQSVLTLMSKKVKNTDRRNTDNYFGRFLPFLRDCHQAKIRDYQLLYILIRDVLGISEGYRCLLYLNYLGKEAGILASLKEAGLQLNKEVHRNHLFLREAQIRKDFAISTRNESYKQALDEMEKLYENCIPFFKYSLGNHGKK